MTGTDRTYGAYAERPLHWHHYVWGLQQHTGLVNSAWRGTQGTTAGHTLSQAYFHFTKRHWKATPCNPGAPCCRPSALPHSRVSRHLPTQSKTLHTERTVPPDPPIAPPKATNKRVPPLHRAPIIHPHNVLTGSWPTTAYNTRRKTCPPRPPHHPVLTRGPHQNCNRNTPSPQTTTARTRTRDAHPKNHHTVCRRHQDPGQHYAPAGSPPTLPAETDTPRYRTPPLPTPGATLPNERHVITPTIPSPLIAAT